jgi:hypothetical protein
VKVVGEITRSEVPKTALTALHHIENQIHCVAIIKNSVKYKYKPWSALYGRVTRGSQLSLSAHKDLPIPVTTPLTR